MEYHILGTDAVLIGEGSRVQSLALPNECEILIAVLGTSKHAITGATEKNDLSNGGT